MNTPGVIYKDLLIVGSLISEDLPAAPGDIRAFDLRTGKIRWSFHTIPHPGEFGYETWPKDAWKYIGGANNWSGMSLDEKRGLVFAGTGSAAFDFYGGNRAGDNLFANCLLALKADTGERVWHFQTVKHDIWDRDLPAPPSLVTVRRDGRLIDAVAQITKSGLLFVFDRETGQSLFPIEYRKALPSDVPGEATSDTQPFPLQPPPFARQVFSDDLVTDRTPAAHQAVIDKLRTLRNRGPFDPPSLQGTVLFPGMDGGGEWGGTAFDPETGFLYVNSNEMVWVVRLVERAKAVGTMTTRQLYLSQCASCHRDDLTGTPPGVPLPGRRQPTALFKTNCGDHPHGCRANAGPLRFARGRGERTDRLPPLWRRFPRRRPGGEPSPIDLPYRLDGYIRFTDPDGYPAVKPPWGTLTAFNLDKGSIAWQIPFGEIPELAAKGIKNTGSENYGGPVVTAGGLIFIGATNSDRKFGLSTRRPASCFGRPSCRRRKCNTGGLPGQWAPIRRDRSRRREVGKCHPAGAITPSPCRKRKGRNKGSHLSCPDGTRNFPKHSLDDNEKDRRFALKARQDSPG